MSMARNTHESTPGHYTSRTWATYDEYYDAQDKFHKMTIIYYDRFNTAMSNSLRRTLWQEMVDAHHAQQHS